MRLHQVVPILGFAILAVLAPSGASAQQCGTTHELVGFTSATFTGGQGVLGFTLACQAELGSDARMCNSVEVMRTTNVPVGLLGSAWVHPVLQPAGTGNPVDASGQSGLPDESLTCDSWASGGAHSGLGVTSLGQFLTAACSSSLRVACCERIPAPAMAAVPSMLWFGRGLLAAMIVSAAAGVVFFRGRPVLGSGERGVERRR